MKNLPTYINKLHKLNSNNYLIYILINKINNFRLIKNLNS